VNVLDENIIASQCVQLRRWRIPFRQIGHEYGQKGMDDMDEIVPLLLRLRLPTLFTRDDDFYDRTLCHSGYCIVILAVAKDQAASYIRRFLRHPAFSTRAQRMGCVLRVSPTGIVYWQKYADAAKAAEWPRRLRNPS
jgi:hypothetical protein